MSCPKNRIQVSVFPGWVPVSPTGAVLHPPGPPSLLGALGRLHVGCAGGEGAPGTVGQGAAEVPTTSPGHGPHPALPRAQPVLPAALGVPAGSVSPSEPLRSSQNLWVQGLLGTGGCFCVSVGRSPHSALPQPPRSHPVMETTTSLLDAAAVGDLVLLDPLTEESLLQTLQERFHRGDIYVSTGPGGAGCGAGLGSSSVPLTRRRTSGTW